MSEIQEIPIEAEDIQENVQDIAQDTKEQQNISEDIPKKGRGRQFKIIFPLAGIF